MRNLFWLRAGDEEVHRSEDWARLGVPSCSSSTVSIARCRGRFSEFEPSGPSRGVAAWPRERGRGDGVSATSHHRHAIDAICERDRVATACSAQCRYSGRRSVRPSFCRSSSSIFDDVRDLFRIFALGRTYALRPRTTSAGPPLSLTEDERNELNMPGLKCQ